MIKETNENLVYAEFFSTIGGENILKSNACTSPQVQGKSEQLLNAIRIYKRGDNDIVSERELSMLKKLDKRITGG